MKIGLFFGSFNPVHIGHMIIANFMVEHTDIDKVWMVVSPQNPFKKKSTLAKDYDRLHLLQLAIGENTSLYASKVEFDLPQPSYTVDTLAYLKEKHPKQSFALIMGGDNLASFHKWKNYELIIRDHDIYVYNRPNYDLGRWKDHERIFFYEAPLMHVSASYIRKNIKAGKSVQYLVPQAVFEYLEGSSLYK
ncbi:MAG: nicotinate-nucleotide adenylyltransferase [Bacteroidia bacterium]|nr:nicotinate-nucleotide adenylyltransferase [Bacteroidia bacterium]